eukprot:3058688-Rhodomonas_salina.2
MTAGIACYYDLNGLTALLFAPAVARVRPHRRHLVRLITGYTLCQHQPARRTSASRQHDKQRVANASHPVSGSQSGMLP